MMNPRNIHGSLIPSTALPTMPGEYLIVASVWLSPKEARLFPGLFTALGDSAEKGCGAYLNGKRLQVSSRPFSDAIFCTAMSTYRKEFAKACSDIIFDVYMRSNDVRRFGSAAIELCLLAAGHMELYFEMRLQPWDYAAASLILSEAGGVSCGFDGKPMSLHEPSMTIAANCESSLQDLLRVVHKYVPELPY